MANNRSVVSVLGADRSGIVAKVAGVLAESGANIIDISQTILDGIFTMTMIVELDEERGSFDSIQARFASLAEELSVQITIQREDIFRFMYRI